MDVTSPTAAGVATTFISPVMAWFSDIQTCSPVNHAFSDVVKAGPSSTREGTPVFRGDLTDQWMAYKHPSSVSRARRDQLASSADRSVRAQGRSDA